MHEAAGQWDAWLIKYPRYAWGYAHLVLKAVLHFLDWVTESPARFVPAAVLVLLAYLFL
jgi:hypothetical protein